MDYNAEQLTNDVSYLDEMVDAFVNSKFEFEYSSI